MARGKNQEQKDERVQEQQRGLSTTGESNLPSVLSSSPFAFMRRFSEEMDRLFDDFGFGRSSGNWGLTSGSLTSWSPQIEAYREGNQFIVRADLPGLTKDDIKVEITDNEIVLEGERRNEREENREGYYRSERSYGKFYRRLPLPDGAKPENAQANFRNGVLEISIEATQTQPRSRRLEIQEQSAETSSRARGASAGENQ
jgi:HSP20 family protein